MEDVNERRERTVMQDGERPKEAGRKNRLSGSDT